MNAFLNDSMLIYKYIPFNENYSYNLNIPVESFLEENSITAHDMKNSSNLAKKDNMNYATSPSKTTVKQREAIVSCKLRNNLDCDNNLINNRRCSIVNNTNNSNVPKKITILLMISTVHMINITI